MYPSQDPGVWGCVMLIALAKIPEREGRILLIAAAKIPEHDGSILPSIFHG